MTDKIRWGILSTGNIAHAFTQALQYLDDAEVIAVGSRSGDRADAFGDRYGIPNRHDSYASLANDPDVDVIYVATPHIFHKDNSLLCLNAGKAVLCEKAFTINAAEAQEVIDTARAKHLLIVEALWSRFTPGLQKVGSLIAEGAIGHVKLLTADFGIYREFDPAGRLFDPNLGGGSLLDIGIYPVMLALTILGTPPEITSTAVMGPSNVDMQSGMLFTYENGAIAALGATLQGEAPCEAAITGTKGRIRIAANFWMTQDFTVIRNDGSEEHYDMSFEFNGYEYEARETMRCLREGLIESPVMTHDDTLALMQTLDRIREQWGLVYPTET